MCPDPLPTLEEADVFDVRVGFDGVQVGVVEFLTVDEAGLLEDGGALESGLRE